MDQVSDNLLAKLNGLVEQFDELESKLSDPKVAADHEQVRQLSVKRAAIAGIVDRYNQYQSLDQEINEVRQIIDESDDADLVDLARGELPDLRSQADELIEAIASELVTADDAAVGSVIVELRSASGGDEAALWAARNDKEAVDNDDFEYARDKVMMGAERRSLLMSDEEKKTTAYHEIGHALVAANIDEVDPVHKVSIIPRGRALGVTMLLPEEDRHSHNKKALLGQISMTMGGRAAEHLVFKRFTTGASDDLKKATELARKMVCQWGMSEKLGPLTYTGDSGPVFLGRDLQQQKEFSNESLRMIDEEVLQILNTCYSRANEILKTYRKALDFLAKTLLEKETIDGESVLHAMKRYAPKTKK